jgi:hypothetical protein
MTLPNTNATTQLSKPVTPPSSGTYTINVNSTTGFTASGTLYIVNSNNVIQTITYQRITSDSFEECSGGTGPLDVGNAVTQGAGTPFWKLLPDDSANAVVGAYVAGPGVIPGTRIVSRSSQNPNQFLLSAPALPEPNQPYTFNGAPPKLTNLIKDGSFETPNVARQPGGFQKQPFTGDWSFSADAGIAANGSDITRDNPDAPQGTQVGFIQGQTNSISQNVQLQKDVKYQISFYLAERATDTGTQPVELLVGPTGQTLTVVGTATPVSSTYTLFTFYYTPTVTARHTIQFTGLPGSGSDNTALIDSVQVIGSA